MHLVAQRTTALNAHQIHMSVLSWAAWLQISHAAFSFFWISIFRCWTPPFNDGLEYSTTCFKDGAESVPCWSHLPSDRKLAFIYWQVRWVQAATGPKLKPQELRRPFGWIGRHLGSSSIVSLLVVSAPDCYAKRRKVPHEFFAAITTSGLSSLFSNKHSIIINFRDFLCESSPNCAPISEGQAPKNVWSENVRSIWLWSSIWCFLWPFLCYSPRCKSTSHAAHTDLYSNVGRLARTGQQTTYCT
jgi:hypothetical protein